MKTFKTQTEKHYYREGLYEDIVSRLKELNIDLNNTTRKDISSVDEFHVRGAQVSKDLANKANLRGARLLDIGCGIGGPCRMLADEYDCNTTGIDLSEEFVRTAIKLSELVGLSDKTTFVCGDATALPFKDATFDFAWTQHVQMNIDNKTKFYSEVERVLAQKGTFLYYDIFKKGVKEVHYPMPWADEPSISFLDTKENMDEILSTLGLKKEQSNDETSEGILFFENLLGKIKKNGPPKLGLNVLMGASTKDKIINLLTGLKEGSIELQSGVYKKV